VLGSKPIVEVKFYVDGTLEQTFSESPYLMTLKLTNGQHTFKVVAKNNEGQEGSNTHEFGVNTDWKAAGSL